MFVWNGISIWNGMSVREVFPEFFYDLSKDFPDFPVSNIDFYFKKIWKSKKRSWKLSTDPDPAPREAEVMEGSRKLST